MPALDPRVGVAETVEALAEAGASIFEQAAAAAQARDGVFRVALAGGTTPEATYRRLATPPLRDRIDWNRVQLWWGDERCVPPDDLESNYRMVRETLLDSAKIPLKNVHRMHGELAPADAALHYDSELRRAFGPGITPRFDLVLLGLGTDGHTASLFPGTTYALESAGQPLVAALQKPGGEQWRLSLTLPVLNASQRVVFIVSGSEKAEVVARVINQGRATGLPAAQVAPSEGEVVWLLDREAAARL